MVEITRARPVRHDQRTPERKRTEGNERTELFAHLSHTYGRLGQLGSQTSSILLFVIIVVISSPVQTQLMRAFLFRCSFLCTFRPEPIGQGGTVIEMGVDETRRSRRLLHARWEMR